MKKICRPSSFVFHFSLLAFLLLAACGDNKSNTSNTPQHLSQEALTDSIENLDSIMRTDYLFDTVRSNKMIGWCNEYAERFPEDSLAPVYLLTSAQIQISKGDFEQGISTLDSIIVLYPGFENVAVCQFLKGMAYEQNQQYDMARQAYTDFVTNYPDHVLASDIRKAIPMVGLSPEKQLETVLAHKKK